jgi:hypothetical protein
MTLTNTVWPSNHDRAQWLEIVTYLLEALEIEPESRHMVRVSLRCNTYNWKVQSLTFMLEVLKQPSYFANCLLGTKLLGILRTVLAKMFCQERRHNRPCPCLDLIGSPAGKGSCKPEGGGWGRRASHVDGQPIWKPWMHDAYSSLFWMILKSAELHICARGPKTNNLLRYLFTGHQTLGHSSDRPDQNVLPRN